MVASDNRNYGFLTFVSDHGLHDRCEAFGNSNAGVYPGAAPESKPRLNQRLTRCDSHHNVLGYSGTMGNNVLVENNRFHHNTVGISTDSFLAAGHPGYPQDSAVFRDNLVYSNNLNPYVEGSYLIPSFPFPIGTGILITGGNENQVTGNAIYDNWRRGTMLVSVPGPASTPPQPDPAPTSYDNVQQGNLMGRDPQGRAMPNGVDFWWDEAGTGNCWQNNGQVTSDPPALDTCPGRSVAAPALGNPDKQRVLASCALWPDPVLSAQCDWTTAPPPPGGGAAARRMTPLCPPLGPLDCASQRPVRAGRGGQVNSRQSCEEFNRATAPLAPRGRERPALLARGRRPVRGHRDRARGRRGGARDARLPPAGGPRLLPLRDLHRARDVLRGVALMRVAIVGAGPSGLAALRALDRAGFDATAYERGARMGGVWTLEDRPTASYRSLHLITSRARTEFAELPMPAGTPDYPSAETVGRYLESYAERFGLTERIRLSAGVERAERSESGGWELELADGTRESADILVVANGHNDVPKWPDPPYPGDFEGSQEHALDYDDSSGYAGKCALVVGMGNSAMDIATDISYVADRTLLSVRHGSWVIPKRLLGRPADQVVKPWVAVNVPWRIRQPLSEFLLRVVVGPPDRFGLPAPQRGLFQDHPTISDTILSRISHGRIEPKPGIEELSGDGVGFTDGSVEPVDAIVWCTGYRVAMPFLPDELVGEDPRELPAYKRVLHLDVDDLFFIGLMQSTGSAFPIVERQSQLLAEHLAGRWAPPPKARCAPTASVGGARLSVAGGRHGRPSMRVDFDAYMHELGRELERGRLRAASGPALSRARARDRRQRRLRQRAAGEAARARLGGGRPGPAPGPG